MTHSGTDTTTKTRNEKILKSFFIGILISTGIFLGMAYVLGNGSMYGTGYEFGKLIGLTLGQIQTSITKGIQLSGALLALMVSFKKNKSILWALIHMAFGWGYILYFLYRERGQEYC
ncbi:hypothetical protein [Spongiimicrobium salis]|uniref:hypothetical protein n=1 Tax=Spongiimicrobium salis TaxID=1667022 RepID=UPI00374D84A2